MRRVHDPFRSIRGIAKNRRVEILAPGPSLPIFWERSEDALVILINGASSFARPGDYFLSDDSGAPNKSWFRNVPEGVAKVITSGAAIQCRDLFPDDDVRRTLQRDYQARVRRFRSNAGNPRTSQVSQYGRTDNLANPRISSDGNYYLPPMHPLLEEFETNMPVHRSPHIILKHRAVSEPVSRSQLRLNTEGTSANVALQFAFVMGAQEIHLFGVEFSNPPLPEGRRDAESPPHSGNNYFYEACSDELGMTLDVQVQTMDRTVKEIRQLGTPVYSHIGASHMNKWNTRLEHTFKTEHLN